MPIPRSGQHNPVRAFYTWGIHSCSVLLVNSSEIHGHAGGERGERAGAAG